MHFNKQKHKYTYKYTNIYINTRIQFNLKNMYIVKRLEFLH